MLSVKAERILIINLHILNTIKKYQMLSPGDRVLIALSGGPDSVCLFYALIQLSEQFSLDIAAAHVNHELRGNESDADEAFVQKLCNKEKIPLFTYSANIKTLSKLSGLSLEETGRNERYRCFYEAAAAFNAQRIALGHNLNDNAETLIMRLCRGSGLLGLCGIPPKRGQIIRPLIETARADIEKYLEQQKLPYCVDTSNHSSIFTRNKIRNEIIPIFNKILNTDICEKLSLTSRLCAEENEFLQSLAKNA
jgi:tRNA(Ile)-lysidine synthase